MLYTAILFNLLLALSATAGSYPPKPPPSADKRFNQYGGIHSGGYHIPIRSVSKRDQHPDYQVRYAHARDEGINHRFKHAARLDTETYQFRKRDVEFLEREAELMKKRDGVVSLTNYNLDMGYAAEVKVGTPPQSFLVVADSGSADFLLFDSACGECRGHPTFDRSKSSTYVNRNIPAYNQYGTGNATGQWSSDTVEMGGSVVENQAVNLVQSGDLANFMGSEISGIMGLGPPSISAQGPRGPVMNTPDQFYTTAAKTWTAPEYGVYLERLNDNSATSVLPATEQGGDEPHQSNAGYITFGGANSTLYTGEIDYMPANTSYWWQLPLQSITLNGQQINTRDAPIVIDTGSTMNYFPSSVIRSIFSSIPGSVASTDARGTPDGMYAFPCDARFDISVEFGGKSYTISPADTIRTLIPPEQMTGTRGRSYCLANFAVGDWLLGAAFMKNVYTVFRMTPPQIGFAQLSDFAKVGENPNYSGGSSSSNGGSTGSNGSNGSNGPSGSNPGNAGISTVDKRSAAALIVAGGIGSLFI